MRGTVRGAVGLLGLVAAFGSTGTDRESEDGTGSGRLALVPPVDVVVDALRGRARVVGRQLFRTPL